MLTGAPSERLTRPKTIGARNDAAIGKISCISATPFADEAVMTRAPEMEAPTQADIAECSLSTATYSESTLPFATKSAKRIGISVDGVMGYAATTSGLIWRIASAKARLPEVMTFFLFDMRADLPGVFSRNCVAVGERGFRMHRYGFRRAEALAEGAALAEEKIDSRYFVALSSRPGTEASSGGTRRISSRR